ncbi:hypothetical protein FB451DRAFT_1189219 [Mycena latifolia]|nr:hypothetical protein FB451DRAFT_1189219 [Mycena latifolia]
MHTAPFTRKERADLERIQKVEHYRMPGPRLGMWHSFPESRFSVTSIDLPLWNASSGKLASLDRHRSFHAVRKPPAQAFGVRTLTAGPSYTYPVHCAQRSGTGRRASSYQESSNDWYFLARTCTSVVAITDRKAASRAGIRDANCNPRARGRAVREDLRSAGFQSRCVSAPFFSLSWALHVLGAPAAAAITAALPKDAFGEQFVSISARPEFAGHSVEISLSFFLCLALPLLFFCTARSLPYCPPSLCRALARPTRSSASPSSAPARSSPPRRPTPIPTPTLFGAPQAAQAQDFSFGGGGAPAQAQPSVFGAPLQAAPAQAQGFSFGAPQLMPVTTPNVFGQPVQPQPQAQSLFGAPPQPAAQAGVFGQPAQPQQAGAGAGPTFSFAAAPAPTGAGGRGSRLGRGGAQLMFMLEAGKRGEGRGEKGEG